MIAVCNHDSYFVQKNDVFDAMGLLPQQKITATLQMLAYGASADQVDAIMRMGKSTILESLMRFCRAIESIYTAEYIRKPTNIDLERLLKKAEMRGFPGMIGSIDSRWAIVRGAARLFDAESLRSIMMTCIILHNMIVEDEYDYEVVDEYEPDMMNNSRTRIYYAHDAIDEPVQHEPLQRDGRYNKRLIQRYTAF
ncbi:uncharacterized protein [Pyrus communis]|uniref:uncharacterized protein n=1 Tax=Pyrus communis TaxID=23211 RepID=UPI0035BFB924